MKNGFELNPAVPLEAPKERSGVDPATLGVANGTLSVPPFCPDIAEEVRTGETTALLAVIFVIEKL